MAKKKQSKRSSRPAASKVEVVSQGPAQTALSEDHQTRDENDGSKLSDVANEGISSSPSSTQVSVDEDNDSRVDSELRSTARVENNHENGSRTELSNGNETEETNHTPTSSEEKPFVWVRPVDYFGASAASISEPTSAPPIPNILPSESIQASPVPISPPPESIQASLVPISPPPESIQSSPIRIAVESEPAPKPDALYASAQTLHINDSSIAAESTSKLEMERMERIERERILDDQLELMRQIVESSKQSTSMTAPQHSTIAAEPMAESTPPEQSFKPTAEDSSQPSPDLRAISPKLAKYIAGIKDSIVAQREATETQAGSESAAVADQTVLHPPGQSGSPVQSDSHVSSPAIVAKLPDPKRLDKQPSEPAPPKDETKKNKSVQELRESLLSQGEGSADEWHPVEKKKPPKDFAPAIEALQKLPTNYGLESKPKLEPQRQHYSLEELAAMDPSLSMPPPTSQQQSIKRLKNAASGGIRLEFYSIVLALCLALSYGCQFAGIKTLKEPGQKVKTALNSITVPELGPLFMQGARAYEAEVKSRPARTGSIATVEKATMAIVSPIMFMLMHVYNASFSANSLLTSVTVGLAFLSTFLLSLLIYFKFRRATSYGILEIIVIMPFAIAVIASIISIPAYYVLCLSEYIFSKYMADSILFFTTCAWVISVFDLARRSFLIRRTVIDPRD